MAELNVGDRIPPFSLPDQDGIPFIFGEALAKGPVVLFFYPKDDTPVCTAEVCSFRDASEDFMAAGATVVGISSDSVASHRSFADRHKVSYRLLSDKGSALRKKFGVPRGMLGLTQGRVTYVIDREGVIRHRYDALFKSNEHVEASLATLRSLKG